MGLTIGNIVNIIDFCKLMKENKIHFLLYKQKHVIVGDVDDPKTFKQTDKDEIFSIHHCEGYFEIKKESGEYLDIEYLGDTDFKFITREVFDNGQS